MRTSEIISWVIIASFNILLISSQYVCPDAKGRFRQNSNVRQHHSPSLGFLIEPKNTTRCLGEAARLRVFYLGDNSTRVTLYKNQPTTNGSAAAAAQQIVMDGKKYHKVPGEEDDRDDYYLFICNLTLDDAGWYTVELRNQIGPIVRKAYVKVLVCNQPYRSGSTLSVTTDADALVSATEGSTTSSSSSSSIHTIVIPILCVGLGLVAALVFGCCYRLRKRKEGRERRRGRRRRRSRQNEVVHVNPIYNQIPAPLPTDVIVLPPADPFWEIPQDSLRLEDLLGEGAFGKVYRAAYVGPNCPHLVAIKMLKDDCTFQDRTDIVNEIEMMKTIGRHSNIVCFYGYSVTQDGSIQVVVEFAKHGSLRDYLRRLKPEIVAADADEETWNNDAGDGDARIWHGREDAAEQEEEVYLTPVQSGGDDDDDGSFGKLTFADLISFCFQVARGMEYLSSRKIIHRDLAARNILVADNRVLKIADFGLTRNTQVRNYYQRTSSGLLPVMWMAPESLADNRYTTRSDVWSFGVLLWEIFSFGADPYGGIPPEELLDRLLQGYRMQKPEFCSDEIAHLIWRCWELNPISRPDFHELVKSFDRFVTSSTSLTMYGRFDLASGSPGTAGSDGTALEYNRWHRESFAPMQRHTLHVGNQYQQKEPCERNSFNKSMNMNYELVLRGKTFF